MQKAVEVDGCSIYYSDGISTSEKNLSSFGRTIAFFLFMQHLVPCQLHLNISVHLQTLFCIRVFLLNCIYKLVRFLQNRNKTFQFENLCWWWRNHNVFIWFSILQYNGTLDCWSQMRFSLDNDSSECDAVNSSTPAASISKLSCLPKSRTSSVICWVSLETSWQSVTNCGQSFFHDCGLLNFNPRISNVTD